MSERFFCPDPPLAGRYHLRAEEARHLAKSSRHVPGDLVELFDGQGFATLARVLEISPKWVELVAEGPPLPNLRAACRLTLATAAPKGDRFDWLVEKATELGAARLIPLITDRSVVDPRQSRLERLRRTVIEACKQCRRSNLMQVDDPRSWAELAVSQAPGGETRLIALQSGARPADWPPLAAGGSVLLAVGPEGGFSPRELDLSRQGGWYPVCFSPFVLRIETAGIAGISAVLTMARETGGHALA